MNSQPSWFDRLDDKKAISLVAFVLFLLNVWPVFIVKYLPYQDLPNHLAAAEIMMHPERFPEFEFNGFLKTNAILFAWLFVVGKAIGINAAAKVYTVLALLLTAVAFPVAIVEFGERKRLASAAFFLWPMLQSWFFITGMLNFGAGVPFSILFLCAMLRYERTRSAFAAIAAALFALLAWYAHVLALGIAGLLLIIKMIDDMRAMSVRDAGAHALRMALPVVPAGILTIFAALRVGQERNFTVRMEFGHGFRTPWELLYNFWDEYFHGFSNLSILTIVPAALIGFYLVRGFRQRVPFFASWGIIVMLLGYAFVPHTHARWAYLSSRFIPFLLFAGILRVPEKLPRPLRGFLAFAAVTYSIGMGIDYLRIEGDRRELTAAMDVVKPQAKLLPLIFDQRGSVSNTHPMMHAWGYYTLEKDVSAPLLFASSRSFALQFKEDPPTVLRFGFNPSHFSSVSRYCTDAVEAYLVLADCERAFETQWRAFFRQAAEHFDHVMFFGGSKQIRAFAEGTFDIVFDQKRLTVFRRRAP